MLDVPELQCELTLRRNVSEPRSGRRLVVALPIMATPLGQSTALDIEELALFDTGSEFTILSREWAMEHGLLPFEDESGCEMAEVSSRFGTTNGRLITCNFTMPSLNGRDISWIGEAWISPEWEWGAIIGWRGVLDSLRFYLDPVEDRIAFGLA